MSRDANYHVAVHRSAKAVLSDNLKRLMDRPGQELTQAEVGKRGSIPQRTVGRIKNGEVEATLGNLQALGKAFGLQAWQLLVPDLDPSNPPMLRAMTDQERALYERLRAALKAIENR